MATVERRVAVGVAAVLVGLTAAIADARAAGFASAEFAGEHGNVVTTNPTALYFNPAGAAFSEGTAFYAGGVMALRRGSWTHAQAASEQAPPPGAEGADTGTARFSNLFGAPALGITTRLRHFAIGGAFYVPFGGRVAWDKNERFVGDPNFPLAVDGVQRWTITEGALTYLYFTLGAAVRLGRLAVGVSGNVVQSSVEFTQAKSSNPQQDVDPLNEFRIRIDVRGVHASFGVGAMFEAVADRLWLGVSYQAPPGLGPMDLDGTLTRILGDASTSDQVTLRQALPDIVRFGGRLRAASTLELRLYGDVTRWSGLETECLSTRGQPCAVLPSGEAANPYTIQNLRRHWKDTYGIRAGVSVWPVAWVELFGGVGFETAATPDATLDPAVPDANAVRLALGGRFVLGSGWRLGAGVTNVQYFDRDNTDRSTLANPDVQLPTRRPDGGGQYALWLGLFQLSLEKQL
jgi:long-chain fatty acid transport protein